MSTFQNAIAFFVDLGIYDVVLPFLMVFTMLFAILEKTRVFGTEKIDGNEVTKKNLNAMISFVVALLVVASADLVRIINTVAANVVVLLLLSILFLLLAGSFHKDEEFYLKDNWNKFFMVLMFAGIVLIFLNALGWLQYAWYYAVSNIDGPIVGSFLMLAVIIGGMVWITKSNDNSNKGKDN